MDGDEPRKYNGFSVQWRSDGQRKRNRRNRADGCKPGYKLSAGHITPEVGVRWLVVWSRIVRSDTLPYVYTLPLRVPYTTLGVQWPVNIWFPDARCVADKTGHDGEACSGGVAQTL